jgi:hypothetical protein
MKSKLIITCFCLGVFGSTLACAGDEEAMNANDGNTAAAVKTGEDKAAKAKADDSASGKGKQWTNADCYPNSVPDDAPNIAKLCAQLANSAPDMPFTPADYEGMPPECQPFVEQKCR